MIPHKVAPRLNPGLGFSPYGNYLTTLGQRLLLLKIRLALIQEERLVLPTRVIDTV